MATSICAFCEMGEVEETTYSDRIVRNGNAREVTGLKAWKCKVCEELSIDLRTHYEHNCKRIKEVMQ